MRLTKKDVVVLALGSLQGAAAPVDTEDVAIAAHALAPKAFGWRKHSEHIDLDMVRTTLRHEAQDNDPRVSGSLRSGWVLTALGQRWVRAHPGLSDRSRLSVAETSAAAGRHRAETREVSVVVDRLRKSAAYRSWLSGDGLTARQAAEAFRIDEYTPQTDRHRKTARVEELVAGLDSGSDRSELTAFLRAAIPAALELSAPVPAVKREDRLA